MKFSYDGTKLFTGSRRDNELICWDIRYLSAVLYSLKRDSNTNQRIYFDTNFYSNYLASGSLDGNVNFYDLNEIDKNSEVDLNKESIFEPTFKFKAHRDCVNGVSLHPFYPLLASCSGQRKFKQLNEDDENRFFNGCNVDEYDNSLKLWWLTDMQAYNDFYK